MDPMVIGGIVSAVGNVAGSLLGGGDGGSSKQARNQFNELQMKQDYQNLLARERDQRDFEWQQRQFQVQQNQFNRQQGYAEDVARHQLALADRQYYRGIQDRVSDAISAGVHPLFALGMQPTFTGGASLSGGSPSGGFSGSGYNAPQISQPTALPGQSKSGSALGEGISNGLAALGGMFADMGRQQNQQALDLLNGLLMKAQIEESKSRTTANYAQAQLFASEGKRGEQTANYVRSTPEPRYEEVRRGRWSPALGANISERNRGQKLQDDWGDLLGGAAAVLEGGADIVKQRFQQGAAAYAIQREAFKALLKKLGGWK